MVDETPPLAERQLLAIRSLLRRDFLAGGGLRESLGEAAEAARAVVGGRRAFVVFKAGDGAWQGQLDDGTPLDEAAIHLIGSHTLLEKVIADGEPILTDVTRPLLVRTRSTDRNDIRHVLVVPIRTWSRATGSHAATYTGCLHVDRSTEDAPFQQPDIDVVLDLANVLERTLGSLRQLATVEKELSRTRLQLEAQLMVERETYRLHHVQSHEPRFIRAVLEPLKRAARADRVGVLLVGPTGAGKTHLAQSFHYESRRHAGPFVVLDCGQVSSSEALGAELFGFARQSGFSAPKEGRLGKAALADGGTLFVDEIGTLPLDLQQRLLRLIEKGRFTPLGASEENEVDVQVIAASNEELTRLVREGRFREDLFWRLSEVSVHVPPLDEHPADIPELVELFLLRAAKRFGRGQLSFHPEALERLVEFPWSCAGNTRGLEHAVNRTVLMAPDDQTVLALDDLVLPELLAEASSGSPGGPATERRSPGPDQDASPPVLAGPHSRSGLKDLLTLLVDEHGGVVAHIASDPRLAAACGLKEGPVPASTVRLRIRQLGLEHRLHAARERSEIRLEDVLAALRQHREGTAAARALGISRDALVWRLRQAGLSVRQALGSDEALGG